MGKYILALDQGTTSSRAILFDEAERMVGVAQQDYSSRPGIHRLSELRSGTGHGKRCRLSPYNLARGWRGVTGWVPAAISGGYTRPDADAPGDPRDHRAGSRLVGGACNRGMELHRRNRQAPREWNDLPPQYA